MPKKTSKAKLSCPVTGISKPASTRMTKAFVEYYKGKKASEKAVDLKEVFEEF